MSSAGNIFGFRLITKFGTRVAFKKPADTRLVNKTLADKEGSDKLRYNYKGIFI